MPKLQRLVVALAIAPSLDAQALPQVVFTEERGDIEVEIDTVHAPISGNNVLRYVDAGFFVSHVRDDRSSCNVSPGGRLTTSRMRHV